MSAAPPTAAARPGAMREIRPASPIAGAYLSSSSRHEDERGFFARIWCRRGVRGARARPRPRAGEHLAQHAGGNAARTAFPAPAARGGEARSLHARRDLRRHRRPAGRLANPGRWFGAQLDERAGAALYVPEGFAHGFQTLVDDADVLYMISRALRPRAAAGVRWDDPALGIAWPPTPARTISERDRAWPDFQFEARGAPPG